ncbi:DUF397 domain-containing protein [Actinorhabdospora filicis]|uniref:DUF397 domain-containing protein n=1 Tax=Actinorhabdospora filicis TaxID=1785913 RepID=A0A9W6SKQ9_9ACTN|nr:DUF397 domain-containing protein [Actinorhabdospora filicis]GLZ77521.1 DUF397 domain-containing protein [Actinorhabdospora filicis]
MCLDELHWRKASHSTNNGACIEAASIAATIAVRDSKIATGHDYPTLTIPTPAWSAFLTNIAAGRFDL